MRNYVFTSESVTEGHPDKICDIISDSILDAALEQDPDSHMAVECTIKDDLIFIYGEANTKSLINYEEIAKYTLKEIGYIEDYFVISKVKKQSNEINNAVENSGLGIGAGDQGIMFGYACDETEELMPATIMYAHKLAKKLSEVRKSSNILLPDGKTQVSIEYENNKIKRIDAIIISAQHKKGVTKIEIENLIKSKVIKSVIPETLLDDKTRIIINPSGSFTIGGSFGDSGTTGRKIVCDTYGGMGRIGGGCLSSKDPTKVDRSAAYYCRYVAKSIVANGLAKRCEVQASFAIGKKNPISLCVDTFGTGRQSDEELLDIIRKNFDFSVSNIIKELDLKKPIYKATSCYGHFGNPSFSWERVKRIER